MKISLALLKTHELFEELQDEVTVWKTPGQVYKKTGKLRIFF